MNPEHGPFARRHESGLWEDELGGLGPAKPRAGPRQACDDVCHLPRAEQFTVDIPAAPHDRLQKELTNPNGMNIPAHLATMVGRCTDKPLADVLRDMTGDDEPGDIGGLEGPTT